MNAAGNPLHPDPAVGERARRAACAARSSWPRSLGVDRVVTMSGCPGGRDGGLDAACSPSWPVLPDDESLWEWQFREHRLAPFWRELVGLGGARRARA